jgi:hypothetical protein
MGSVRIYKGTGLPLALLSTRLTTQRLFEETGNHVCTTDTSVNAASTLMYTCICDSEVVIHTAIRKDTGMYHENRGPAAAHT